METSSSDHKQFVTTLTFNEQNKIVKDHIKNQTIDKKDNYKRNQTFLKELIEADGDLEKILSALDNFNETPVAKINIKTINAK